MKDAIDYAFLAAVAVAAATATGHAVIYKRDSRSASIWVLVIWILPALGPVLYALLGVNRVERRAMRMRRGMVRHRTDPQFPPSEPGTHFTPLARLVGQIVERRLCPCNAIDPLIDGAAAFPAMLEAINGARTSIALAVYIFDGVGVGAEFVAALGVAAKRGVEVRVLIDDVDARFNGDSARKLLRGNGVNVAVFNPPLVPARLHAMNLRNHRKILVVDGAVGFTGGLNVDTRYWRPQTPDQAFRDLQFRLRGPVVAQLMEVFADDWQFTTAEALRGAKWFPPLREEGSVLARAIEAGPDEAFERVRWAIIGGLNAAQRSIKILTPYFIPDQTLVAELNAAALRGVEVDIVIPERTDLPHVHWAMFGQLWQVLDHGCRVWSRPGPFDHSKLMVVDGAWTLLGSANWDARSLRLNFELNVECYSVELGAHLDGLIQARISASRALTLEEIDARPLPVKLRDGLARLFAPYL
ncbi:MAG TPA: phospholipase D-like domain-containing protein [Burkholderiales bacterium]|nr:phospholipase D-like domain-containing protein [Burkholderiales bacterium]